MYNNMFTNESPYPFQLKGTFNRSLICVPTWKQHGVFVPVGRLLGGWAIALSTWAKHSARRRSCRPASKCPIHMSGIWLLEIYAFELFVWLQNGETRFDARWETPRNTIVYTQSYPRALTHLRVTKRYLEPDGRSVKSPQLHSKRFLRSQQYV